MSGSAVRDMELVPGSDSVEGQRERFDEIAGEFARDHADVSDALLDLLTGDAIKQWRLQDATFWQRIKFRSRMLRALELGARRKALPPRANGR